MIYKELGYGGGGKAVYIGSFRGNKRDGFGEMTWGQGKSEAETFKGFWHNDMRVKGVLTMADGSEYDGFWKNDTMHGKGKFTFKADKKGEKGIIYEGIFVNGIQEREGKLHLPNGDTYIGQTLDHNR